MTPAERGAAGMARLKEWEDLRKKRDVAESNVAWFAAHAVERFRKERPNAEELRKMFRELGEHTDKATALDKASREFPVFGMCETEGCGKPAVYGHDYPNSPNACHDHEATLAGTKVEWSREGYHFSGTVLERAKDDRGRDGWLVETPLGQTRWMSTAEVEESRVRGRTNEEV